MQTTAPNGTEITIEIDPAGFGTIYANGERVGFLSKCYSTWFARPDYDRDYEGRGGDPMAATKSLLSQIDF